MSRPENVNGFNFSITIRVNICLIGLGYLVILRNTSRFDSRRNEGFNIFHFDFKTTSQNKLSASLNSDHWGSSKANLDIYYIMHP